MFVCGNDRGGFSEVGRGRWDVRCMRVTGEIPGMGKIGVGWYGEGG